MFKDFKIRTKLLLAFGLIIVLASGAMVFLLTEMNALAQNTQRLYQEPYAASNHMWTVRRNLVDMERVLYKLASVDRAGLAQARTQAEATLSADSGDLQSAITALREMLPEAEEQALLTDIISDLTESSKVREEIMSLIAGGRTEEAAGLLTGTYEPLFASCNEKVLALFALTEADAADFAAASSSSARTAILIGIFILFAGLATAVACSTLVTRALNRPINQLRHAAEEMSRGNLKVVDSVTYTSKDELGQLADSLRATMTTLSTYVDEISDSLLRLSQGDLTESRDDIIDYLGDFSQIKTSFITILKSFNNTLGEISQAAYQVDLGSDQVSSAAQALSEGATEQAASIEELTATVEEISGQIRENADSAQSANDLTSQVSREVEESNRQMERMNEAMAEIGQASQEISKIMATIENIAFQTNILALNAAVEAARAGTAGKGFAVVADEVRSLANKSQEASQETAALIARSVQAVENGVALARATSQSLSTVADTTQQVVHTVDRIAGASVKQAKSVEEVTTRVEQISAVVQTNSATAEESAAASKELSGQASLLDGLVKRFRLFQE